jgi:hypothetical protein
MSFADLKKKSKLGSLTSKLIQEVEKTNSSGGSSDDRIWKPEVDKAGNGYAVIRFLPAPDGEEMPWAKLYTHAFQGSGWFIDNCLTTLGQNCPVCESNRELWNTGSKANQEIVRQRKRKLSYYSNIYVVRDPAHPENEGKVFLYKYGKKIFDKISAAMQPEFEDETPIDPFDFWQGADFKLKIKKVAGYWNYDSSEFSSSGPLLDDDDAMEAIWKRAYSLEDFVSADKFKTYEQLDARMKAVLGQKPAPKVDESFEDEETDRGSLPQSMKNELDSLSEGRDFNSPDITSSSDEDDALSYFQKLAEE